MNSASSGLRRKVEKKKQFDKASCRSGKVMGLKFVSPSMGSVVTLEERIRGMESILVMGQAK